MSTGVIIAIVVVVLSPGARRLRDAAHARHAASGARAPARRGRRRPSRHASARAARAEEAEQIAEPERAEAELHETRARMHERGLADDELEAERERLGDGASCATSATRRSPRTTPDRA